MEKAFVQLNFSIIEYVKVWEYLLDITYAGQVLAVFYEKNNRLCVNIKKRKQLLIGGNYMRVLSTIVPSKTIQTDITAKFPNIEFLYQEELTVGELTQAEVLITYGEDLENQHIRKAPKLKWIMVMSAGLEKMPFDAIIEQGILVTNARGIHKIPMAEYTFAMVLLHEKKGRLLLENERNEKWDRDVRVGELNGKTMLILGTGAIGGEIARMAKAFNMQTIGMNRSGSPTEYIDRTHPKECPHSCAFASGLSYIHFTIHT